MKLRNLSVLFIFILTLSSNLYAKKLQSAKSEIIHSIDNFGSEKFDKVYSQAKTFLKKQSNNKSVKLLNEKENYIYLKNNYKKMLKTIVSNESQFIHKVGLFDKNDISYFQINVGEDFWNLELLSKITQMNYSKEEIKENIDTSAFVALHILIYNCTIYSNIMKRNKFKESKIEKLVATYNNPTNLNKYYVKKAKKFLRTL